MTDQPSQDAIFRAQHVGGSEVSALFDANPWLTHFELWHRKNGTIATPEFNGVADDGTPDNERIWWGVRLETVIAEGAIERYGYAPREGAEALSNGKGMGGHPDCRVTCPQRGKGLLEVKMVDWLERKKWGDEPPLHYLLQGNTYAGLDGCAWFDIIVLVGGNKLERFQYDFRPKLFAEAEKRVEAFWQTVRDGKPPKPDYTRDGPTIAELYGESDGGLIDLRGDNLACIAAAEFLAADAESKAAAKRRDAAKAELMDKMGANETALLEGFVVKAATVKAIPDTIITAEMVGQTINGRKSYRRFAVKEKETK